LIPLLVVGVSYFIWKNKFIWWELFIPIALCSIAIPITYYIQKETSLKDVEYNGYIIQEARYYESWTSWVSQTCTRSVPCGTDSKGNTTYCTEVYDCSYCDENSAYWVAIDNGGNEFQISEVKYNQLMKKWGVSPKFHELNRTIHNWGSCGDDGDMYNITWNGSMYTSEASTLKHSFDNIVKISHSAFNYPDISEKEARKIGLYDYPKFYDTYKQQAILGLDSFKIQEKERIQTLFEYLNGNLGPKNKVRVFTLLFKNKPIDIAFRQEAYWDGGNQNEFVVCIGLNDTLGIDWVKPFTWCDNKRISVDTREDIMELNSFKASSIYHIYEENIPKYFKYKSFKDFNYLTFDPTDGQLIFVYILSFVLSIGTTVWCVKNNISEED
jgi:hypothetical protein